MLSGCLLRRWWLLGSEGLKLEVDLFSVPGRRCSLLCRAAKVGDLEKFSDIRRYQLYGKMFNDLFIFKSYVLAFDEHACEVSVLGSPRASLTLLSTLHKDGT